MQVRVEAAERPRLSVSDDGPGVPEHRRAKVLRPLVQLDESRGRGGSGLGLAIVAAVAARHGAELRLSSAEPGLRVDLRFPALALTHV